MISSDNGDGSALAGALKRLNDHWTKVLAFMGVSLIGVGFSFSDPNSRRVKWSKGPTLDIPRDDFAIGLTFILAFCIIAYVIGFAFVAIDWKAQVQNSKDKADKAAVRERQQELDGPLPSTDFPSQSARGDWMRGWIAMLLMLLMPLALSIYALLRLVRMVF